jgi:hypothetical protein
MRSLASSLAGGAYRGAYGMGTETEACLVFVAGPRGSFSRGPNGPRQHPSGFGACHSDTY